MGIIVLGIIKHTTLFRIRVQVNKKLDGLYKGFDDVALKIRSTFL